MLLRVLVFAAFIAACSASAFAQTPANGVWAGTGLQVSQAGIQSTWTIRLTVRQGGKSEIEYPSLGCKGELTQISSSNDGIEFDERITSGDCIDHGRMVLTQRSGRVFWFWYLPAGGPADASAVLYQGDRIS